MRRAAQDAYLPPPDAAALTCPHPGPRRRIQLARGRP